jgi:hypothetical protein
MANKVVKDMLSLTTETRYNVHTYKHSVLTVQNKGIPARYCGALCRKLGIGDSTVYQQAFGVQKNPKHRQLL